MTIKAYVKNVYGKEMIYVADEKYKKALYVLTGKITIDSTDIQALKVIGIEIEYTTVFPSFS